ncbi:methyltransferase [Paenibacillus ferrarius]|uniref:Methyltransferase n=1 Tax=Paenibacillus ferrarius TaxID=1469647 RepID=A0A1V4HT19_9BACL|nr:class I SAM-dependent methyltransferase [Paenibacillus ferrarius]OPH62060.1 methyltransferase [Paenibacillus ferrarius]
MDARIKQIRAAEKKYHEACYDQHTLFEAGSWLNKPVKSVMDTLSAFDAYKQLNVLDLGSGIGRNSIPIAETLKNRNGQVDCVDILASALVKLREYSEKYEVSPYIKTYESDIGDYVISKEKYDYIIAVSSLEHAESERKCNQIIRNMVQGTKVNGINCIIINTEVKETEVLTGANLAPMMEVNLSTEYTELLLSKAYEGWEILQNLVKPLTFTIERNERKVLLYSECLTYVARQIS